MKATHFPDNLSDTPAPAPLPAGAGAKNVILPHTRRVLALARECATIGCFGAIHGPAGTGKTTALKTVAAGMDPGTGQAHRAKYFRAFAGQGPTRGLRDLLDGLEVPSGIVPPGAQIQHLVVVALRELQKQSIGLLCIDEADGWSQQAFAGVVGLYDRAIDEGWPLGIVLAGSPGLVNWLRQYLSGLSRTLRCEELSNLDSAHSVGLLHAWDAGLGSWVEALTKGEKSARRMASIVMRATGGNPRRLFFFSRLLELHYPGESKSPEAFEHIEQLLLKTA